MSRVAPPSKPRRKASSGAGSGRSKAQAGAGKPHFIYVFGAGRADGRADMKQLLGGKGANLA